MVRTRRPDARQGLRILLCGRHDDGQAFGLHVVRDDDGGSAYGDEGVYPAEGFKRRATIDGRPVGCISTPVQVEFPRATNCCPQELHECCAALPGVQVGLWAPRWPPKGRPGWPPEEPLYETCRRIGFRPSCCLAHGLQLNAGAFRVHIGSARARFE